MTATGPFRCCGAAPLWIAVRERTAAMPQNNTRRLLSGDRLVHENTDGCKFNRQPVESKDSGLKMRKIKKHIKIILITAQRLREEILQKLYSCRFQVGAITQAEWDVVKSSLE